MPAACARPLNLDLCSLKFETHDGCGNCCPTGSNCNWRLQGTLKLYSPSFWRTGQDLSCSSAALGELLNSIVIRQEISVQAEVVAQLRELYWCIDNIPLEWEWRFQHSLTTSPGRRKKPNGISKLAINSSYLVWAYYWWSLPVTVSLVIFSANKVWPPFVCLCYRLKWCENKDTLGDK